MNMKKKNSRTCIVAVKNKQNKIIMAADRRISSDDKYQESPIPKIAYINGFLVGGTGDCELLQLITENLALGQEGNITSYMYYGFKNSLVKTLKQHGYRDEHNLLRLQKDSDLELLVAKEGRLFSINFNSGHGPDIVPSPSTLGIIEVSLPYATGCGGDLAWGSLLSTDGDSKEILLYKLDKNFGVDKLPKNVKSLDEIKLLYAINVAAKVSSGCDSRIDIIKED